VAVDALVVARDEERLPPVLDEVPDGDGREPDERRGGCRTVESHP
jgi:hypothetical protein